MTNIHTNGMKIAISIPEDVFRGIEKIAKEQKTSRSRVIASAAREYILKNETLRLIAKLNEAYSQPETPDESASRRAMTSY